MAYFPSIPPEDEFEFRRWLEDELNNINASVIESQAYNSFELLYAEPAKYEIGQIVFADGTTWNPGAGQGMYERTNLGWAKLGGGDGNIIPTAHSALTGLGADDHTQYHTDARGDARYYSQANIDARGLNSLSDTTINVPVTDQVLTYNGSDWINKEVPTDAVTSVDGRTGVVTLDDLYEPFDATILKDSDLGGSVQPYDVDTAKLDVPQTWAALQKVPDNLFNIIGGVDATKIIAFEVDGLSTATTRTVTMPDQNLDLTPSTGSFEAADAGLLSIAGLTTAADNIIYTTASDTYAVTTLTTAGRALIDDASASAQRTTLGVAIGTDVQEYNANLLKFDIQMLLPTGANDTFTLAEYSSFPFTVDKAYYKTDGGTITAAIKIGGTDITGLGALSLTTTQGNSTASAANTMSVGSKLTCVTSADASGDMISITLHCTRT